MCVRKLLVRLVVTSAVLLSACADDTASGVAGFVPDVSVPDQGVEDMGVADTSSPDDMQGLGGTGDSCSTGEDCESGICLNGVCAEACSGDADCPDGSSCVELEITLEDGSTETVSACVEDTPCTADGDCAAPDVCVVDRSGDEVDLTCDDPSGPADVGAACTDDSDCASGLCLDGVCSAPCDTSNDCSADGSFVCEITTITTDTGASDDITVCVPRPPDICLSDSECSGTDRCVASKTMTAIEFACADPVGAGESAEACVADADCAQNLCIDGACAGPCETVGDCGGPPLRCEVTNVDLGNNAMDSAQICVPPIQCANQGDCPVAANEVCYVREDNGVIDPICRNPNVGGGGLGQVCNADSECANNLCSSTRFRDVCVLPCVDDADCGVVGYECGTAPIDLMGGGTQDLGVCVPESPPACTSEADCATGLDCAIIENLAGDGLESVCVPGTGGAATGVACVDDEDCASLVCLNGFCASPCVDSADCGGAQLCLNQTVTKAPNNGDFDVCTTLPDVQCTSTDDCTDGTRVCGEVRFNSTTMLNEGHCTFPNVGQQQLGADCTQGSDCRENVCLASITAECTVICDKDSDCAASQGCTTFGDLNFCNTTCSDNSDCGAPNRYCTINGDEIADDVDQICRLPIGAGDVGTTCTTSSDCLTGLCLRTLTFNGQPCVNDTSCAAFPNHTCECPVGDPNCTSGQECAEISRACTALCDDAGDCAAPLTDCSPDIFVSSPSGNAVNISACAQP